MAGVVSEKRKVVVKSCRRNQKIQVSNELPFGAQLTANPSELFQNG